MGQVNNFFESSRASYVNARLSNGNINQNIVTCSFHSAKFDITTGIKVGELILKVPPEMEPLPQIWQNIYSVGKEMSYIKTYNQKYDVTIARDTIEIKILPFFI
jgi:nitrite reductase/ring-hydroxylating ferredoxin subunit